MRWCAEAGQAEGGPCGSSRPASCLPGCSCEPAGVDDDACAAPAHKQADGAYDEVLSGLGSVLGKHTHTLGLDHVSVKATDPAELRVGGG